MLSLEGHQAYNPPHPHHLPIFPPHSSPRMKMLQKKEEVEWGRAEDELRVKMLYSHILGFFYFYYLFPNTYFYHMAE